MKHISNPSSFFDTGRPFAAVLDDHFLYTQSFTFFLERSGNFRNVYGFTEKQDLIDFLKQQKGQSKIFLFIDLYLKDGLSLSILNDLRRIYKPIHIIMSSSVTNPLLITEILNYKIDGFLSKFCDLDEIGICIQYIKNKQKYISPIITDMIKQFNDQNSHIFSPREVEILNLFAKGLTVDAAAKEVHLSMHTIISHKRSMMTKTKSKTITELLAFARKIDLI